MLLYVRSCLSIILNEDSPLRLAFTHNTVDLATVKYKLIAIHSAPASAHALQWWRYFYWGIREHYRFPEQM